MLLRAKRFEQGRLQGESRATMDASAPTITTPSRMPIADPNPNCEPRDCKAGVTPSTRLLRQRPRPQGAEISFPLAPSQPRSLLLYPVARSSAISPAALERITQQGLRRVPATPATIQGPERLEGRQIRVLHAMKLRQTCLRSK